MLALPIALSSCNVVAEISLAETIITSAIGSAVTEIAAPVIKPIAHSIHAALGIKEAKADESSEVELAARNQIVIEWRSAHGGLRFECRGVTEQDCETRARSEADERAHNLADKFERAYASCSSAGNKGHGNLRQSVSLVEDCTSAKGFTQIMAMIDPGARP